ncbi:MAG: HAD family hydrolase [Pseudomonadota bacterium]
MNTIKAIIFDLDGTLLDTLDDLADCMNRVLIRNQFPTHPVARYRYFVGDGIEKLISRTLPQDTQDKDLITKLVKEMMEEYGNHWQDRTRPYDGIEDMLSSLTERGLSLNILSNKPDAMTRLVVATFFPSHQFDYVAGAREDIPKKPDPAGAIAIAAKLRLTGKEILYLGDTATDMKTAVNAGMNALGALWGFRTAEELKANGACALLAEPGEILHFIQD